MKQRIIVSFLIAFLIVVGGLITIYFTSTNKLTSEKKAAIERAYQEADIKTVNRVDWFHYNEDYYILEGINQDDESIIVWVPVAKNEEVFSELKSEGLTEDEAISLLYQGIKDLSDDKRPKQLINIKFGMVEGNPAYEITYRDQKNRYSIFLVDFYNGDWYRVYNL